MRSTNDKSVSQPDRNIQPASNRPPATDKQRSTEFPEPEREQASARQAGNPFQLPRALLRWRTRAYGDSRDDIRAALSAGSDIADDLITIECALSTATEDPSSLDPETQQRVLNATARLLHERAFLLVQIFDYLWIQPLHPHEAQVETPTI